MKERVNWTHVFLLMIEDTSWHVRSVKIRMGLYPRSDQRLTVTPEETLVPWPPIRCPSKTLLRLHRCTGRAESSIGAHTNLYHLMDTDSTGHSYWFVLLLYVPRQQLWSWRDGQFT